MCSIRPTAFKIAGNFPEVSSSGEYTSQIHTLETAAIAGQLVYTTQAACIPQTAHALQAKFTTSSSNPAYTPSILTFVGSPEETTYYQSLHLHLFEGQYVVPNGMSYNSSAWVRVFSAMTPPHRPA